MFGLALARQLAGVGKSVILFEAGAIGAEAANASAGLLGALMPPSPLVTGPLAAVQLRCLSRYKTQIDALEAETGLPTGYRRHGRLQPITSEAALAGFAQQQTTCAAAWRDVPVDTHLQVVTRAGLAERHPQLADELTTAPYGYAVDQVSAQVEPRQLLAALASSLAGKATLQPHARVLRIDGGQIVTVACTYTAKQVIVTAGWQTGGLVPAAPVIGVKGQACATPPLITAAPLLYTRGGYAVFHDGVTALGSTTETHWTDPAPDRATCETLQTRIADWLPALAAQPLIEYWAGVRPKTTGALPLILQHDAQTLVVSGGYKVGLALAFELADWITAALEADAVADTWRFIAARENLALPAYA